jgi:hypothetical protein
MLLLKCKLSFGINRDPAVFLNEHINMFSTAVQTLFDLTEPVLRSMPILEFLQNNSECFRLHYTFNILNSALVPFLNCQNNHGSLWFFIFLLSMTTFTHFRYNSLPISL